MERVPKSVKVLPLYGALPLAQQDAAIRLDPTGEHTHSPRAIHPYHDMNNLLLSIVHTHSACWKPPAHNAAQPGIMHDASIVTVAWHAFQEKCRAVFIVFFDAVQGSNPALSLPCCQYALAPAGAMWASVKPC